MHSDATTRLIPLTQGLFATVDAADFDALSQHRWCATKHERTYYAIRHIGPVAARTSLLMHRVILGLSRGEPGVDHRDGDGLNNTRTNLRPATPSQNGSNRARQRNNASSPYKGVSRGQYNRKWRAQIGTKGQHRTIGYFLTAEEAAQAYDAAAVQLHGEFARLNFPHAATGADCPVA